ncbi:hypothetical protein CDAR_594841 [Caerostris darwini]|uniref:Uncharacterized protein n=1 Tax=Caerostris darwini TaxID=1538125 RepID=A0AAV4PA69_9ARAC|nr:hypothetical protein CDAR_594841 [Caerostris darwini]
MGTLSSLRKPNLDPSIARLLRALCFFNEYRSLGWDAASFFIGKRSILLSKRHKSAQYIAQIRYPPTKDTSHKMNRGGIVSCHIFFRPIRERREHAILKRLESWNLKQLLLFCFLFKCL